MQDVVFDEFPSYKPESFVIGYHCTSVALDPTIVANR